MGLETYFVSFVVIALSLLWYYYKATSTDRRRKPKEAPDFGKPEKDFLYLITSKAPRHKLEAKINSVKANAQTRFFTVTGEASSCTYSLLMYASHHYNPDAMEVLLDHGADPSWRNNKGTTVLHLCARRGQKDMAEMCLKTVQVGEQPGFIQQKNDQGLTPLEASIRSGQGEFMEFLVHSSGDAGKADIEAAGYMDKHDSLYPNFGPSEEEFLRLVKSNASKAELQTQMETDGFNVNAKKLFVTPSGEISTTDFSLLMFASHHNHGDALDLLLSKGADPLWRNNRGTTVLGLMAKRGQLEMAKSCLDVVPKEDQKLFINQGNTAGWTPLHSSIQNDRMHFSDWLLFNDADPNAAMVTGWTPLHTSVKTGNFEREQKLKQKGGDCSKLASHRSFGKNVSIHDVKDHRNSLMEDHATSKAKITQLQAAKALTGLPGHRTLVAIINIVEFGGNRLREGAKNDLFIRDAFEKKIDCEVMTFNDQSQTKENYRKFISKVQNRLSTGDFGILLCIVSSHGGEDSRGQFFCDVDNLRIYVRQELKDCFSIERCAAMEGRFAVFLVNACRTTGEDDHTQEAPQFKRVSREAKHLIVQSCSSSFPSLRDRQRGSAFLLFFKQVLTNYGATISVQSLFNRTQCDFLDKFSTPYGNDEYRQNLMFEGNICEDIFFREKQ